MSTPAIPAPIITRTLSTDGEEIRRFADSSLQSSIDKALSDLPPDRRGAVVAYADLESARLAVVARLGSNWSVVGVLSKSYSGPLAAQAAVRFTW